MQSLSRQGEVKDCVKNYGMIIADECHHASAFTYEKILKTAPAKYIYGLTATPTRKDGHHPILFMHCGPIRYRDNAKKQAEKRPFDHYIIPRFTSLRIPLGIEEKGMFPSRIYTLKSLITKSEINKLLKMCWTITSAAETVSFYPCELLMLNCLHKKFGKRVPIRCRDTDGGYGDKDNPGGFQTHRRYSG